MKWLKHNIDRIALSFFMLLAPAFIAWTGGYDFDQRGPVAAAITLLGLYLCFMGWQISSIGRKEYWRDQ